MPFRDLRDFVAFLETKGDLKRIQTEVTCDLEIAEITDRVTKSGGPALFFENVAGHDVPVITNLFGTEQRMCSALGVQRLHDLSGKLQKLLNLTQGAVPTSMMDKFKVLGDLAKIAGSAPKTVSKAPCQEVVLTGDSVSLDKFPVLKSWPDDAGRFITLPLVITRDPENGTRNVGMYRLQIYDQRTTGMHWHLHKIGRDHFRRSKAKGQRLEAAVAIGADPVTIYTATAPLPPVLDELFLAGFLRGEGVETVRCKTVNIEVPAHAEIVLEGYVDPSEERLEGPFGDHTGYYSLADNYPVFHITCITHRAKPWYAATIVGKPPMEDVYLGKATERLFLPLIRMIVPEVVEMNLPPEGVFQNLAIVSIDKQYPGQAKKVISALWGMMQMALTKIIIVVDGTVDVHDLSEVLWRVSNNVDPRRDLVIAEGPLDDLDHSSPLPGFGSKLGIDATTKMPNEGHPRPWPADVVMSGDIRKLVDEKWSSYDI
ncbi:MAG: menaquinone biosynthesis decarboxylase [Chloroflexi bacterium]|nr:menaquinone biosynthesis decarboxylase [Chloroflexota bacterium]MDA8187926.1 menaquinone biosynthesis decarboxylase [Dehalococcoidales bacterium]